MLTVERGRLARPRRAPTLRADRPRPRPDVIALAALGTLIALGLLNLHTLGATSLVLHQGVIVAAGACLFFFVQRFRATSLHWLGWACYGLSVLLLVVVVLIGDAAFGARRWLTFGSYTLQPSELAKVGLLLVLAQVLAAERAWYLRLPQALAVAAVPIGLVVIEPDLSTTVVLSALTVTMLVLGRIPLKVIAGLIGAVALAAPYAETLLHPYQAERLNAFLSGSRDVNGAGWTILQAHIALAWGGQNGQRDGPLHLLMSEYLPERETDLAYASLVQQWGLRAGMLAVVAAALLVWRLALCSRYARNRAAATCAAGVAALIGIEVSISVAANLGLIPTAGVPFPLVSYGGTAAAVHIVAVGLVLGMRADAQRHELWIAPSWRRKHPRLARLTAVAIISALVGMVGFALHLQHSQGPQLRAAGLTQMTRCVALPAPRGVITDRHGKPLTVNLPQYQVWAVRGMLSRSDERRLAALIARPRAELRRVISAERTELTVKVATLPEAAADRVKAARLHGVLVVAAPRRYYPYGALLGTILGWTGVASAEDMQRWPDVALGETVGRAGLEQQYDPILRGVDGRQCVYVDPASRPVALGPVTPPVPGANLRLSLDLRLQVKLDQDLAVAIHSSGGGQDGAAIVMDPRNGEIFAMASRPSYDNNVFGPPVDERRLAALYRAKGNPMLQHATQVAAPPGSTFKLVVAAADMVHPVIPADEVIPTGGAWNFGGHVFHNWSALPPQALREAIAWSNNVYFYQLAARLGAERVISMAHRLGVGQPTGIDLPGESSGYLGTPQTVGRNGDTWYPGSTVLLGIGQGYLTVTPMQDLRWTAAVATGRLVTPHFGLAFQSSNTAYTALDWPDPHRLRFAHTLGPVRDGMRQVVTNGTALLLQSLPEAGGKTGTAEDASAGGQQLDSWLSAVAPMSRPRISATALIRGQGDGHPSSEVVRAAMAFYFAHEQAIRSSAPAN